MNSQPRRRLFFALWPDDLLRARLVRLLREGCAHLAQPSRRVRPENLHLTLAFLGEIEQQRLACIAAAGDRTSAQAFELRFDHWGHFRKSGILYLGARELPAALARLVSDLWDALENCALTPDKRPFRPHLTMARKVAGRPELAAPEAVSWNPSEFVLVESKTMAGGPEYRVLRRWPFDRNG